MKNKLLIVVIFAFTFFSCQKIKHSFEKPVHIRIVNTITDARNVSIKFSGKKNDFTLERNLSYKEHTDYLDFPQGKFKVEVEAGNKKVLDKDFGFGPDSYYTLLISGLSKISKKINEETTSATLKWTFGGIEAKTKNGLLPQLEVIRDNLNESEKSCKVRVVNRVPSVSAISVNLQQKNKNEKTTVAENISYIKNSATKSLKPGKYEIEVKTGSSIRSEMKKEFTLEKCKIYTIIFVGNPVKGKPLELIALNNPLKPCLK